MSYFGPVVRAESISNVTLTPSVELGTRAQVAGVDYVYAYNGSTATLPQGRMGNIGTTSMNSGFTFAVTNAASQVGAELVIGVAANADIPTLSYGWLAVKGPILACPDNSSLSANSGDFLTVGVDGGFVSAPVTISTSIRLGIAIQSFICAGAKIIFKSPLFG